MGHALHAESTKMSPADLQALIASHLPEARVIVQSDDNVHFEALVVCAEFTGKRQIQRHQMVYRALGDRMGGEIHALSIKALTPEEQRSGRSD
jgi:acid stress-induced BolA-like protein IbaG/YrbA